MRALIAHRVVVPGALFLAALALRVAAAYPVDFPPTEVSAYYVAVGRNVVAGEGMVSDAVWSYATPPLVAPKPAFDLWLPMATLIAIPAMLLVGPSLLAAQLAHAVVGAALAPLAWIVAHDAATRTGMSAARRAWIALTAGLLAALLGPLLVAAIGPDSATPFAVFAVASAVLVPAAIGEAGRPRAGHGLLLGVLLGLAYLSRQEAVFLALVIAILVLGQSAQRVRALLPIVVGGAAVTLPWLVRNALTFGTVFPGQAIENALLVRPVDIFAWADRPSLPRFLEQGAGAIAEHVAAAFRHNLVDVLLVAALPAGIVGLVSLVPLRRTGALAGASPLRVLVLSGALTFAFITVVFPVATLSGTWLHASGPTLIALAVLAALGSDHLVAWIARARAWTRSNAWLAPVALLALAAPMTFLQVTLVSRQTRQEAARVQAIATGLETVAPGAPVISDHPMWLAEALERPVLALPDEAPEEVHGLARHFGAQTLVVLDERGRYPARLEAGVQCFTRREASVPAQVWNVDIDGCRP